MHKAIAVILLSAILAAGSTILERANALYERTEYDAALRILQGAPASDAAALALAGKAHFGKADYDPAYKALEKAVEAAPGNDHYWNWLGKAYGRRAETGNFLTAPGFAKKCRRAFERSVELNPRNAEAASDLFQYYLNAPGFLGGGVEKAEAISRRMREAAPAEHHFMQAELARKRGDLAATEKHLRKAMELEPDEAGRALDLAVFLLRTGRYEESGRLFDSARQVEPPEPKALFVEAQAYIEAKRNLPGARLLLERYLASEITPDDPPRREAEKLLRKVNGG